MSIETRTVRIRQPSAGAWAPLKAQQMAAEKSLAIVLRVVDFSETSCIVTLFTEDFGRISALAKGARRPKSPFESALDLLSLCRIVFLRKSGDALDLLTEAKLEQRFRAATRSLPRLYGALYLAELVLAWTEHHDCNRPLFELTRQAITGLDGQDSVTKTILHFEIHGLHLLGLAPSLQGCVECGEHIPLARRAAFGLNSGGVLCDECKRGQRQVISISSAARTWMHALAQANHYRQAEQAVSYEKTPQPPATATKLPFGELRGIMHQIISHQLERRPRLYPFLVRYCQQDERDFQS